MKFNPTDLTVNEGDSITWINKDLVPHTVTAENGSFASKPIEPEKSWKLRAAKKKQGPYKCLFHPAMKANLVVK